jgi:hypothetical protein
MIFILTWQVKLGMGTLRGKHNMYNMRFDILTAIDVKITILNILSCSITNRCQKFGRTSYLHLQVRKVNREDGGRIFLQNKVPIYQTTQHLRIPKSHSTQIHNYEEKTTLSIILQLGSPCRILQDLRNVTIQPVKMTKFKCRSDQSLDFKLLKFLCFHPDSPSCLSAHTSVQAESLHISCLWGITNINLRRKWCLYVFTMFEKI